MDPQDYPDQDGRGGNAAGYFAEQNQYDPQVAGQPQYGDEYQTASGHDLSRGYDHPNGADDANPRTSMDNEPGGGWGYWAGNGEGSSHHQLHGVQTEPMLGRFLDEGQETPRLWRGYGENVPATYMTEQVAEPVNKVKENRPRMGNRNSRGNQVSKGDKRNGSNRDGRHRSKKTGKERDNEERYRP